MPGVVMTLLRIQRSNPANNRPGPSLLVPANSPRWLEDGMWVY